MVRAAALLTAILFASASANANASARQRGGGSFLSVGKSRAAVRRWRSSDDWIDPEYKDMLGLQSSATVDGTSLVRRYAADRDAQLCSSIAASGAGSIVLNTLRGSFLRIASDLTGGTPLESIKTRVTATTDGPIKATRHILNEGGLWALWAGTPSRTVEGALLGALFLVGSSVTKKQVIAAGGGPNLAALCGGLVGGVVQAIVMTPAGMVFTSLNLNRGKPGYENDNAVKVTRRIIKEKGIRGMFIGGGPMATRQASNWASRSLFTEIVRTNMNLSKYGVWGEITSGAIGGVGSCWNTPVETVRVIMQGDVAAGLPPKTFNQYWSDIIEDGGVPGLFRGVTPRAIQAIWQTVFMVVVPNILGV